MDLPCPCCSNLSILIEFVPLRRGGTLSTIYLNKSGTALEDAARLFFQQSGFISRLRVQNLGDIIRIYTVTDGPYKEVVNLVKDACKDVDHEAEIGEGLSSLIIDTGEDEESFVRFLTEKMVPAVVETRPHQASVH